jgi:hypothetical protein
LTDDQKELIVQIAPKEHSPKDDVPLGRSLTGMVHFLHEPGGSLFLAIAFPGGHALPSTLDG